MSTSILPLLPLPHPFILLPTARLTVPLSKATGEALLGLSQQSENQPIVAAVPLLSSDPPTLHNWGTSARIVRLVQPLARNPDQPYLLTLHGLARIRVPESEPHLLSSDVLIQRKIEYPQSEGIPSTEAVIAFKAAATKLLAGLAKDAPQRSRRDIYVKISHMIDEVSTQRAAWMADVLMAGLNADFNDKLDFLSAAEAEDRLQRATALFVKRASISEMTKKIAQSVDESLSKQQKEFFLRQQLAAIQRELHNLHKSSEDGSGSSDVVSSELDDDEQAEAQDMAEVRNKIEAMAQGSEERKMAVREWKRLKRIPQGSVEHGVIRNYLEWLTAIPWPSSFDAGTSLDKLRDRAFLTKARQQLDADHFGLEKIKKRLIEYLAVVRLKELKADSEAHAGEIMENDANQLAVEKVSKALNGTEQAHSDAMPKLVPASPIPHRRIQRKPAKGPILLFVGPPGTGKTSLGQSIAHALDRPFQRISLGGVRDEAEIRGHRRTYVASGPGAIAQALRKAGRPDPVILLDEIDKVGQSNFHGDPAAALLEVLDPEQNHSFNDHYINVPIDLSQVLFICTSNTLDTISAPLLDRCEIIQLSGYTYDEKTHIARRFLLPKQLQANGLTAEHVTLTESALMHIATYYTREAGVRSLERAIGAVVRYKAVEWAEHADSIGIDNAGAVPSSSGMKTKAYNSVVEECELEKILGIARWDEEEREREERRGVVYGLVVTGMGEGGILPVETIAVPGSGKLKLTGSLGEVIKESGELALSWVKTHAYDLYITKSRSQDPLKVPDPMDIHLHLPSGAVKKDGPSAGIAMTCAFVSLLTGACVPSNIAMTGEVTLRGRVGAVGGIKEKVILPWANRKDVEHDVPLEIRSEMQFAFVRTIEEALEAAFGKGVLRWRKPNVVVMESRL
ncbi:Lon protease 2, peroxisomal [Grifola frondosa]|uniref:Lon protease homolog n=1 Tax=Grifola frondosa TaxID=5627 RepID=A0A1C7MC39_GRIFR|nr:Lon protease 2, peroxisomal [Grifola frondosa]